MQNQTLYFKWSPYDVKLTIDDAKELLDDQSFLTDALLMCLDKKACDESDIPIYSEELKERLIRHYMKMNYCMDFVMPILNKLDNI
jgi:hypothetical protein